MTSFRIYSLINCAFLAHKIFVCKDRLIFIPINLVSGKDKMDIVIGSELVFNSPIDTISLGIQAIKGERGKTWLSNAKPDPITVSPITVIPITSLASVSLSVKWEIRRM